VRDLVYVGSSPPEETCAQVGSDDYYTRARRECTAYIEQLRRALGREPDGARLSIKSCPHDFGDYLEVVCHFESDKPDSVDYALRCESDGPPRWDGQALLELYPNPKGELDHEPVD
jgi:hypothetical protein